MRTDEHNNPTAFTTDVAKTAGLTLGVDYEVGRPFQDNAKMFTAKILLNPIEVTLRVIDKIGFYNKQGAQRWVYIAMPKFVWDGLPRETKVRVLGFMYQHEGGTELRKLFPETFPKA
jgi:hypothetical protein